MKNNEWSNFYGHSTPGMEEEYLTEKVEVGNKDMFWDSLNGGRHYKKAGPRL